MPKKKSPKRPVREPHHRPPKVPVFSYPQHPYEGRLLPSPDMLRWFLPVDADADERNARVSEERSVLDQVLARCRTQIEADKAFAHYVEVFITKVNSVGIINPWTRRELQRARAQQDTLQRLPKLLTRAKGFVRALHYPSPLRLDPERLARIETALRVLEEDLVPLTRPRIPGARQQPNKWLEQIVADLVTVPPMRKGEARQLLRLHGLKGRSI